MELYLLFDPRALRVREKMTLSLIEGAIVKYSTTYFAIVVGPNSLRLVLWKFLGLLILAALQIYRFHSSRRIRLATSNLYLHTFQVAGGTPFFGRSGSV